jgi:hypothetical protein
MVRVDVVEQPVDSSSLFIRTDSIFELFAGQSSIVVVISFEECFSDLLEFSIGLGFIF